MTAALAVELLLALLSKASEIGAMVAKLNMEGRTTFTPDEWAIIVSADDAARKRLVDAIAAAKAGENPPTP